MSQYVLSIDGREYRAEIKEITPDRATVVVDGTEHSVLLVELNRGKDASAGPRPPQQAAQSSPASSGSPAPPRPPSVPVSASSGSTSPPTPAGRHGNVRAPLPGLVLGIKVDEGDTVEAGATLMVLEAMKMENTIQAPHNGTVRKIFVREGDSVGDGDPLLELSRPEMTTL